MLGLLWFSEQKCDVVCFEVGMGGRFDATNIIDSPEVAVITRIGLDHTAYLGNTLSQVAFEKCGIIKGGDVVCYPEQKSEAYDKIKEICECKGSKLYTPQTVDITNVALSIGGSKFKFMGKDFVLNMAGEHQIYNAVTAICAVETLEKCGILADYDATFRGLESVRCAARIEVVYEKPLMIIDGAHNNDKISSLYDVVKDYKGKIVSVCGMLRDKDFEAAVKMIAPLCKRIYTVSPDNPRALTSEEFALVCREYCDEVCASPSIQSAVKNAVSSLKQGDIFLSWGSLYIAGEIKSEISSLLDRKN